MIDQEKDIKDKNDSVKQVFQVIHEDIPDKNKEGNKRISKDTKWTKEEHLYLIFKGIQNHGKQWTLLHSEIQTKTPAQIRTHAQNFLIKAEAMDPEKRDVLEFIKSMPSSYFLTSQFEHFIEKPTKKERFSLVKENSNPCFYNNEYSLVAKGAKRKANSEIPAYSYKSDKPFNSENGRIKGLLNLTESENFYKKRKKVDVSQKEKKEEKKVNYKKIEEEKVPLPVYTNYPSGMSSIPTQLPMLNINDKLGSLSSELSMITQKLEMDLSNNRIQINSDSQLGFYWSAMYNCTISLQHIVNDVSYIHYSASPYQSQYMYPPPPSMYYQHPMPHPMLSNYLPFQHEKSTSRQKL